MKWNLLTLVIDVVVVVVGVSYVLEVRDDKKWEPARKLVSENGALAAAWMAHAGHYCFKTDGVALEHQHPDMRVIFLRKFINHINRFEESIHLCNAGLGKDLMPIATEAVWKMKQVVPIFNYLFFAMSKQSARQAVLYEIPEKIMLEVFELGQRMQRMYDAKIDEWLVSDPQISIGSMTDFIDRHHHIYLIGSLKDGVKYDLLHVFDANMLRTFPGGRGIDRVNLFTDA
ncbi:MULTISPECIES: hypothetical protein [unclassified Pseudomonas]|uniref:hypothetical protein n=1 Tax=unclassified Pseudomonas TaxID=196821 RepID=UPI001473F7FE|nr:MULTISPECIES: hypothetical protein [unclassified Pseudomonas]NMX94727.1 hypothetical protein [Pseudomonas sp. WS 5086]NMY45340.1 hypothetical protein [Pseudomonas sp. WS 5027]